MYSNTPDLTVLIDTIDAHQHFWHYHPVQHAWINDEMAVIRQDFMPADLEPVLAENGAQACVAVQADQTTAETDFLLQLASQNDFIKGVVGWVDLMATNLEDQLAHYKQYTKLKGFRHILQGEAPAFMLQPGFCRGIGLLKKYGFTYDILIYPRHLAATLQLVMQFPEQAFVVDHIAKPYIKQGAIDGWAKELAAIAQYPNVHCKISGMVTEANMRSWKQADFTPYLDEVTKLFGVNRLMYGSDWPVCLAAGSYREIIGIVRSYFSNFSAEEQAQVFKKNAAAFYQLI